jgi:hypothetical protein
MIGSAEAASDRIDFRIVRFNILLRQRRISSKALTDPCPIGLVSIHYRLFLQRQIWQNAAT